MTLLTNVCLLAQSSDGADTAATAAVALPFIILWFLWMGLILMIWLAMVVLIIGGGILWIMMVIDYAKRDFAKENDKIMWGIILLCTGVIGGIIYYYVVKKNNAR